MDVATYFVQGVVALAHTCPAPHGADGARHGPQSGPHAGMQSELCLIQTFCGLPGQLQSHRHPTLHFPRQGSTVVVVFGLTVVDVFGL